MVEYSFGGLIWAADWTLPFVVLVVWLGFLIFAFHKRPAKLGVLPVLVASAGVVSLTFWTFVTNLVSHAIVSWVLGLGIKAVGFLQFTPVLFWGKPLTGYDEPWMWLFSGVAGPSLTIAFGVVLLLLGLWIRWPTISRALVYSGMFAFASGALQFLPIGEFDGSAILGALFMVAGWWNESPGLWGTSAFFLLLSFICVAAGLSLLMKHRDNY